MVERTLAMIQSIRDTGAKMARNFPRQLAAKVLSDDIAAER
jgi:hypothetical protein